MLKKALILLTVVVLLAGFVVMPASAATVPDIVYDYMDISECNWQEDGYDYMWITAPKTSQFIIIADKDDTIVASQRTTGNPTVTFNAKSDGSESYRMVFMMKYLWTHNFPTGTEISLRPTFKVTGIDWETGLAQRGTSWFFSNYYESDPLHNIQYYNFKGEFDLFTEPSTNFVDGVIYNLGFAVNLGVSYRDFIPKNDCQITVELTDFAIEARIPTEYRQKWIDGNATTLAEKNNYLLNKQQILLEDLNTEQQITNDKLDELPNQVGDEMQDIIDKENQSASEAGDSAAGELMDIIPNESQGFMDAIQSLVSSMSYSGTDAKLPVPAITIPAIPGVMDAIQLTDELYVDFGYWVQQLPGGVLKLVQILCTIALIVYCFKELYGMIAYAMTLKGGGSSE